MYMSLDGITIPVNKDSGAQPESEFFGSEEYADDGTLRSSVRLERRKWEVTTIPISQAAMTALEAAVALGRYIPLVGTSANGGPVNVSARITNRTHKKESNTAIRYIVALRLKETGT